VGIGSIGDEFEADVFKALFSCIEECCPPLLVEMRTRERERRSTHPIHIIDNECGMGLEDQSTDAQ
jgi:hypothetical protein